MGGWKGGKVAAVKDGSWHIYRSFAGTKKKQQQVKECLPFVQLTVLSFTNDRVSEREREREK